MPNGLSRGACVALGALVIASPGRAQASRDTLTVRVHIAAGPTASIDPRTAFGGGLDGHRPGDIARLYTPENIRALTGAGFGVATYRLRTELANDAWHWNPAGRWSDSARAQGYWTSDTALGAPIETSRGYRLPRRGNTVDQADDRGYSRVDDGDTATFWKSDPYLDSAYTGEPQARHPQWVIVDLGRPRPVDAMRILWAAPYATRYDVEYWAGEPPGSGLDENPDGAWHRFPLGARARAAGGHDQRRLSETAVETRFVRIWLRASSHTSLPGSRDARDALGYAIRELEVGRLRPNGGITDYIRHAASRDEQTVIAVSSTDPWHRASDVDAALEQPGLDLVFRSGLTQGRAPLIPVPVLFGTPDDAAAEIAYLRRRGYPLDRVELGEEPDGQYVSPDDYGALYVQWVRALRAADSAIRPGGPSWQSTSTDLMMAWRADPDTRPWLTRFLGYLRDHGAERSLTFFSFEWYPYDSICAPAAPQLARATSLLDSALAKLAREGLPLGIPRIIAEYGYSAFAGESEVNRAGALLDADAAANFVSQGGAQAYLYGWEPSPLDKNDHCDSWGNNTMFVSDAGRRILDTTATYFAARMLTREWLDSTGVQQLYRATVSRRGPRGAALVTAYAARRPDGTWALLLANMDPRRTWRVTVTLDDTTGALRAPISLVQFGAASYVWHAHGASGFARPDGPFVRRVVAHAAARIALPPWSLTVVRWSSSHMS
ncbi:MAG TPA: discoidin domain-containing protein [Gemmatimonadaceae bacterium]|nr:discoidin domain-containing protein [Gemmatimonadaceae bacterium]